MYRSYVDRNTPTVVYAKTDNRCWVIDYRRFVAGTPITICEGFHFDSTQWSFGKFSGEVRTHTIARRETAPSKLFLNPVSFKLF